MILRQDSDPDSVTSSVYSLFVFRFKPCPNLIMFSSEHLAHMVTQDLNVLDKVKWLLNRGVELIRIRRNLARQQFTSEYNSVWAVSGYDTRQAVLQEVAPGQHVNPAESDLRVVQCDSQNVHD